MTYQQSIPLDRLNRIAAPVYALLERPKIARRSVIALLIIQSTLLAYSAHVHSPTYNEPAHLVAGISYWQFGRMDLYRVNPPLVRLVAAAPVLLSGCETDWKNFTEGPGARSEMALGEDFCKINGDRAFWLMTIARWACIPFSLLGGYICFLWGSELYGNLAGLLSMTLWSFCPNLIAHGQLITCDAAATSLAVTACYAFWLWLKQPTWWNTFASGIILGVAELTKTTLVIFYPLWPLLWLIYRWPERRDLTTRTLAREFAMLCVRIVIGLYVINLGYGFEGSFTRLGEFKFVSGALTGVEEPVEPQVGGNRFADSWLGMFPVPLPRNYVLGIDQQREDFESYWHEFYLHGVWSKTGWWYYYLYALAVKVPLGTWLLIVLAGCARPMSTKSASFRDEFYLLAPAITILFFVSSQTGMNEHMRYVLPIFPFFFIWIGRLVPAPVIRGTPLEQRKRKMAAIVGLLANFAIVWTVWSSLQHYPHSLAYFNEVVGGPKNGWKHLVHSNLDWGQDLLYLKHWVDEHPEASNLRVGYFGAIKPSLAGVLESSDPIDGGYGPSLPPGWYAVSSTLLSGFVHGAYGRDTFEELRQLPARELVGGTIHIFRIDHPDP